MAITQVRARIDGQWYTLTYNSATSRYETEIIPARTSFHQIGSVFNVALEATNDTGITVSTDGDNLPGLRLKVVEDAAPVLTLLTPAPGYVTTNQPVFSFTAVDEADGSGIDPDSIAITLDGGTVTGFTLEAITNGYRVSYTPPALSEGHHTITVTVADQDGNRAELTAAYIVDTVPPTLELDRTRNIVDDRTITVSGKTNDITAPPVELTVGGVPVTVRADGGFSKTVSLNVGENDILVRATDGAGLVTEKTLYVIRLITDRTQEDVDRGKELAEKGFAAMTAAERAEWLSGLRGAYNATDLNRVTAAMEFLDRYLTGRGYHTGYQAVHPEPGRDRWLREDIPQVGETDGYLGNVEAIRDVLPVPAGTPEVPADMEGFTYGEANDIEAILVAVDGILPHLERSYIYSGEAMSGEF